MLERHDFEHYLTKIFEEGSLGRVYIHFVDACREIDRQQATFEQPVPEQPEEAPVFFEEPAVVEEEPPQESADNTFEAPPENQTGTFEKRESAVPFEFLRPTR